MLFSIQKFIISHFLLNVLICGFYWKIERCGISGHAFPHCSHHLKLHDYHAFIRWFLIFLTTVPTTPHYNSEMECVGSCGLSRTSVSEKLEENWVEWVEHCAASLISNITKYSSRHTWDSMKKAPESHLNLFGNEGVSSVRSVIF